MAKQYLERGLLVPDHVITRVMMTELEKRRAEHWLLDGECLRTGGSRGPLEHRCAAEGVAEAGERPKVPFGVLLAAGVGAGGTEPLTRAVLLGASTRDGWLGP